MRSLRPATPNASEARTSVLRPHATLRLLVAASLCVLASLALTTTAHAHTELVSSTPAAGGVAPLALDRVVLTFSTDLVDAGTAIAVLDAQGREVPVHDVESHDSTVDARINLGATGPHTLRYRVVGQDGHPIVGELSFTVDASATGRAAAASAPAQLAAATRSATSEESADASTQGLAWWMVSAVATGVLVLLLHRGHRRHRAVPHPR